MKIKYISFLTLTAALALVSSCSVKAQKENSDPSPSAVKLIFETDMGNDVDDALALDMIYKYVEAGKAELLGISTNKRGDASPAFIDILASWYGHSDIPIGVVANGVPCDDAVNYAEAVNSMKDNSGQPLFTGSGNQTVPSVELYRRILASQPDSSVTVVSVGFSTNLAALLSSPGDSYSPLSGRDLVAKKVKQLVTMAGAFETEMPEYNVVKDIPAAQSVFSLWPTTIVTSPFELGIQILYPGESIENDFNWGTPHPMAEAYKSYLPMPYDRPTWDLTSVMYAVEGARDFSLSKAGKITVDDKAVTRFTEDTGANRYYLSVDSVQAAAVKDRLVKLITTKPDKYSGNK